MGCECDIVYILIFVYPFRFETPVCDFAYKNENILNTNLIWIELLKCILVLACLFHSNTPELNNSVFE